MTNEVLKQARPSIDSLMDEITALLIKPGKQKPEWVDLMIRKDLTNDEIEIFLNSGKFVSPQ